MRDKKHVINLPSLPSFLGNTEFDELKKLLSTSDVLNSSEWSHLLASYRNWEDSFAGKHTSNLNRKLMLYKMLKSTFPALEALHNPDFIDIILSSVKKPGENVFLRASDGRPFSAMIVTRTITDRLGVLLTLQNPDGVMFDHEVFD